MASKKGKKRKLLGLSDRSSILPRSDFQFDPLKVGNLFSQAVNQQIDGLGKKEEI